MGEKDIKLFKSGDKPRLDQIGNYIADRLNGPEAGIEVSKDNLGNHVYKSLGKTEATLFGPRESTLVASSEGVDLVRNNPGILHLLTKPDETFIRIGGKTEGEVYKVPLKVGGKLEYFAVKYYFPIDRPSDVIFTPGIDQMRIMQLAEKEQPLDGLKYATPLLATIDMTVSPFIEDSLNMSEFLDALHNISERKQISEANLSDEARSMIAQMKRYDLQQNIDANTILPKLNFALYDVLEGLSSWLKEASKRLPFDVFSENLLYDEPENLRNFLISIPEMWEVFQKCVTNPEILQQKQYDTEAILKIIRPYCHLVEITVGSKEKTTETKSTDK
jgi:hypothetical protein